MTEDAGDPMRMASLFDLSGRVALITGATSGLGRAIADAMSAHGAAVVVSGLAQEDCDATVRELRAAGHEAHGIACDVGDAGQVETLVAEVTARCGRIDVLVCNAGVQGPAGPIGEISDADWDTVMGVNLRAAMRLTSLVIPGMAARGEGRVILMASIAGVRGNRSIGLYGLSKAALAQLARNLAVEWGPRGICVNAISPGLVRTPFSRTVMRDGAFMERRLALTPLRRVGEPHEVAGVAVMLASAAGGFVTGQNLVVDGGTTVGDGL